MNSHNNQNRCDFNSSPAKFSKQVLPVIALRALSWKAEISWAWLQNHRHYQAINGCEWLDIARIVVKFYTALKNNVPMVMYFTRTNAKGKNKTRNTAPIQTAA